VEHTLSPDEHTRAHTFYFADHRQRFVACRAALRRILGRACGTDPAALQFRYGMFGKPQLAVPRGTDLHFNVSHAAGRALIAVVSGVEVGVDLEALRRVDDVERLARSVFSDAELRELSVAGDKDLTFLRGWTRKEAYAKALGTGLSETLRDLSVATAALSGAAAFVSIAGKPVPSCCVFDLACDGHVAALAVRAPDAAVVRRTFDEDL
jgi:4'-phosphopantetheinyl transferase